MLEDASNLNGIASLFELSEGSALFVQALTHPSFTHETPAEPHNQRLEFLGDAILDFVVSEVLYDRYPESAEGKLTRTRSQLVNTEALARFARHHHLSSVLRFGKGAGQGNLHDSDNVLADAVEALIAAAYLEGGIVRATTVCQQVIDFGLSALQEAGARDAKSELQEKVQALGMKAPSYRVLGRRGPAHDIEFEVEVSVKGQILASGIGRSKRGAERQAAQEALVQQDYLRTGDLARQPESADKKSAEEHEDKGV